MPIASNLVGKPEVQSLVSFVLGCRQVVVFLFRAHVIPCLFALLVSPDVVSFDKYGHNDVPCNKGKKNLVTPPVVGLVICSVDLSFTNCQSKGPHVQCRPRR